MRFPYIFDWLDWCLIWYWPSLFVCFAATFAYKVYYESTYLFPPPLIDGWHDIILVVFVGFCAWVVLCAIRNGFGVG